MGKDFSAVRADIKGHYLKVLDEVRKRRPLDECSPPMNGGVTRWRCRSMNSHASPPLPRRRRYQEGLKPGIAGQIAAESYSKPESDTGVLIITSLLLGPPGAGKSMPARRLTAILPAMTLAEAIETTRIHHVAALTGDTRLVTTAAVSRAASDHLRCGPDRWRPRPMPGEVSLAHNGVLFLDAWPEFRRHVLRSCANRSRRVSHTYNLAGVLNLHAFVALAARLMTAVGSGRGQ